MSQYLGIVTTANGEYSNAMSVYEQLDRRQPHDRLQRRRLMAAGKLAVLLAVAGTAVAIGQDRGPGNGQSQPARAIGTLWPVEQGVILEIDFRDGSALSFKFDALPEQPTVMELMKLAQRHPRCPALKMRGEGESAFLESIDDLGTARGKGWLYKVDGRPADRSMGVYDLKPGQVVRWSYGNFGEE
jgi:hypothetical protein